MKRAASTAAWAFLASRIWVSIFVYIGHLQREYLSPVRGGWEGVSNWWLNPWTTYDSKHFLDIALHGYTTHTAPFFPFYAWLLQLAGSNQIVMAAWGVLLSNIAFLIALYLLFRLTEARYDSRTAQIAVWLTALSPAAPYFSAVYSESVFLLSFVATLWYFHQKRWALAAVCGFLAALTRSAGILIFVGLCVQYGYEFFKSRRVAEAEPTAKSKRELSWQVLAVLAPLAGFLVAQFIIARQVGSTTQSLASHQEYFRSLTYPWMPLILDFWDIVTLKELQFVMLFNFGATVLALVLLWKYRTRQPISYSVMLLGLLLMQLTYSHYSIPRTQSSLRLLSTMIPFLQPLAATTVEVKISRPTRLVLVAFCAGSCAFFAWRFGLKDFIG